MTHVDKYNEWENWKYTNTHSTDSGMIKNYLHGHY